jgi:hypothetical protein
VITGCLPSVGARPKVATTFPGPRSVLHRYAGPDVRVRAIAIMASLSLVGWMDVQTTPLTPHPSDPALAGG